jgi:hypothetical protein
VVWFGYVAPIQRRREQLFVSQSEYYLSLHLEVERVDRRHSATDVCR